MFSYGNNRCPLIKPLSGINPGLCETPRLLTPSETVDCISLYHFLHSKPQKSIISVLGHPVLYWDLNLNLKFQSHGKNNVINVSGSYNFFNRIRMKLNPSNATLVSAFS